MLISNRWAESWLGAGWKTNVKTATNARVEVPGEKRPASRVEGAGELVLHSSWQGVGLLFILLTPWPWPQP